MAGFPWAEGGGGEAGSVWTEPRAEETARQSLIITVSRDSEPESSGGLKRMRASMRRERNALRKTSPTMGSALCAPCPQ